MVESRSAAKIASTLLGLVGVLMTFQVNIAAAQRARPQESQRTKSPEEKAREARSAPGLYRPAGVGALEAERGAIAATFAGHLDVRSRADAARNLYWFVDISRSIPGNKIDHLMDVIGERLFSEAHYRDHRMLKDLIVFAAGKKDAVFRVSGYNDKIDGIYAVSDWVYVLVQQIEKREFRDDERQFVRHFLEMYEAGGRFADAATTLSRLKIDWGDFGKFMGFAHEKGLKRSEVTCDLSDAPHHPSVATVEPISVEQCNNFQ